MRVHVRMQRGWTNPCGRGEFGTAGTMTFVGGSVIGFVRASRAVPK